MLDSNIFYLAVTGINASVYAGDLLESFGALGLVAAFESVKSYSLALGVAGMAGGVLLFVNHKQQLNEILSSDASDRVISFEWKKYRRRATASALITSVGCMLAALYWVSDAVVFAAFILMILSLLLGILGIALVDMFSIGLQQIATPDEKSRKTIIEEYLRKREELLEEETSEEG